MKRIGETKIGKLTPKPYITYPLIRLPPHLADVIGKKPKSSRPNTKEGKLFDSCSRGSYKTR